MTSGRLIVFLHGNDGALRQVRSRVESTTRRGGSRLRSLTDSTTGAHRVATAASTYWVDLDRMVLHREHRTEDANGALHIGLHVVGVASTARWSTPVVSIERIASPGERRE